MLATLVPSKTAISCYVPNNWNKPNNGVRWKEKPKGGENKNTSYKRNEGELLGKMCIRDRCEVCSKSFTQSCGFAQHKLIHSGIKKYQCDVCLKSFTQSCDLARHKLIHSGIKKYQCDVCSKSFTQSGELSIHKLTHGCLLYTSRCV